MKKGIAIALIVIGVGLGSFGMIKQSQTGSELQIGNLELSAKNKNNNKGMTYIGVGIALLVSGILTVTFMKD